MSQKDPILRNQTKEVSWNIVLSSPHAVAYRLWKREPGSDWKVIGEGGMSDDKVDSGKFRAKKRTEFSYWLGIASTRPRSHYNVSVVLSQSDTVLQNGMMHEKGRVNNDGMATRLEVVTFRTS